MGYAFKNAEGPVTERQTWGLFKIIRQDIRQDVLSRKINRREFSDLMGEVHAHRAANNSVESCRALAERLLANFPPAA